MRRINRKRVIDETIKKETSDQTKEIKQVLQQKLPIEDVIRFSDAEHEKLTNRYWFKFPPVWRTIVNQELIIGIRSTSLKTNYKPFKVFKPQFRVKLKYKDVNIDGYFTPELNIESEWYGYKFMLMMGICLRQKFWKFFSEVGFPTDILQITPLYTDDIYAPDIPAVDLEANPKYVHARDCRYRLSFCIDKNTITKYDNLLMDIQYDEYDIPFMTITTLIDYFKLDSNIPNIHIRTPYFTTSIMNTIKAEDIILTSSLANQSRDNYIGKGNQTFIPIKQYPISSADSTFWIDLSITEFWRSEGIGYVDTIPVELNEYHRSSCLIEIQLITQDRSQYI